MKTKNLDANKIMDNIEDDLLDYLDNIIYTFVHYSKGYAIRHYSNFSKDLVSFNIMYPEDSRLTVKVNGFYHCLENGKFDI